ncbi:olfactory receptor 10Q1-like, partial [Sigmodon hispidus]
KTEARLHTPMYYFLGSLSGIELCYTAVVVPHILANTLQSEKTITLLSCATQMVFFIGLGSADCFLLASMAYDRYVAICNPLRYTLIMTITFCVCLVVASVLIGLFLSLQLVIFIFCFPFCQDRGIEHFFCDVPPVMRLVCATSHIHELSVLVAATLAIAVPFIFIATTYVLIVAAVLKLHSAAGRHRAFNTCSSHLTVVLLQYGCCAFMYLRPNSNYHPKRDQYISLVYTLGTPFLNPLIYTLRNTDTMGPLMNAVMVSFSYRLCLGVIECCIGYSISFFRWLLVLIGAGVEAGDPLGVNLRKNIKAKGKEDMKDSLRTPMYFFLCNLSLLEICYTTDVVPVMLSNIFGARKPISLAGCGTQMFFFLTLGGMDCFLLAIMAYDRYVAICHPLHYTLIMTRNLCVQMVLGSLSLALFLSLQLTALIFTLPFCGHHREINHFLCDVPPVLRLACADTHVHQAVLYVVGILVLTVPFLLICISYVFIASTILRMRSAEGRQRAFSTCSSHLTVVLIQYGCCSLVYLRPRSSTSEDEDRQIALVYTFVTPLLNPLIYTLRNKDVKGLLHQVLTVKCLNLFCVLLTNEIN